MLASALYREPCFKEIPCCNPPLHHHDVTFCIKTGWHMENAGGGTIWDLLTLSCALWACSVPRCLRVVCTAPKTSFWLTLCFCASLWTRTFASRLGLNIEHVPMSAYWRARIGAWPANQLANQHRHQHP